MLRIRSQRATDDHMRTTLSFVDQSETVEKEGGRGKGACIVVYTVSLLFVVV